MNALKILIVDDEPHIVRVLQLKLKNAGYEVITASNGMEGLAAFDKEQPTIVITDINMPILDGKAMCALIEERKGRFPFFVIVTTSSVESHVQNWAKGNDRIHFIEKPFSPRKILELVESCISVLEEANAGVGCQSGVPSGPGRNATNTGQ